jgi:hypothetical protein
VGREIVIEADCIKVSGKLIHYAESNHETHMPVTLILKTSEGMAIMRAWDLIKIPRAKQSK